MKRRGGVDFGQKPQQKKYGKKSEKAWASTKLDRKSSRGMIYENEELRLRTININAEVERGQSDIRKLRRENEQLRREIWSLRDEYDRLNKLLKTTNESSDNNQCNTGDGKHCCDNDEDEYHNCSDGESDSQSDNSGSCDCDKDDNNDYDWSGNEATNSIEQVKITTSPIKMKNPNIEVPGPSTAKTKDICYDHLSIVSEETLPNSDECNYAQQQQLMTFSPTSPTEPLIPPLSHFENLIEQSYMQNEDLNSHSNGTTSSSTTTGETVIQNQTLNDWDFNLQSPFLQRKQYNLNQQQMQLTTFTCAPATGITTTSTTTSPKHFFSPLKPKIHLKSLQAMISEIPTLSSSQPAIDSLGVSLDEIGAQNNTLKSSLNTILAADLFSENKLNNNSNNSDNNGSYKPDICVSNVLGSPLTSFRQKTTTNASTQQLQQKYRESYFQNGGNLEDLLQDIEILSSDILKMQLEKTVTSSAESLTTNAAITGRTDLNKSLDNISKNSILESQSFDHNPYENNKDRKPYRSEMNLVLNYNGQNPVFVPTSRPPTPLPAQLSTISTIKKILQHANSENDLINDNKPSDLIDPSVNYSNVQIASDTYQDQRSQIPRPMTLFPENHSYIGFEPIDRQLPESSINLNSSIPIPISPLVISPPPPSPNAFGGHFYHNAPALSVNKFQDNPAIVQQAVQKNLKNPSELKTATINSALMKRRQFSKRSDDNIAVVDSDSLDNPQITVSADNLIGKGNSTKEAKIKIVPSLSDKNENSSLTTPMLQKQNSTHSSSENKEQQHQCNRRNNSSGNTSKHRHHHHHHSHHHHQKSGTSFNRKLSQESAESNTESMICGTLVPEILANKSSKENELLKMSSASSGSSPANKMGHNNRRHSEGLLTPPISGHHHHPRNSGLHDSHHDLFSAGNGTSLSERNSNSLASSRDSSATSLSLRSHKNSHQRKISISSHNDGTGNNGGGKIPWCACWGLY